MAGTKTSSPSRKDLLASIDIPAFLAAIPDTAAHGTAVLVLNIFEQVLTECQALSEEVQLLRDEVNRLKGEQGKPTFKPKKRDAKISIVQPSRSDSTQSGTNHSSEKERSTPKTWHKRAILGLIKIDREQSLTCNRSELPDDVVFKGFETFVSQGIRVITDNVRFRREKFYSPSTGKIYLAPLPPGYEGGFSPELKTEVLSLYFDGNMSQSRILSWLRNKGIKISAGTVSSIITNSDTTYSRTFYQECAEIFREGLKSTIWQATDHTSTRVDGEEWQCQVVGNEHYTIFATTPSKDRLSIVDVLANRVYGCDGKSVEREYILNETAYCHMEAHDVSQVTQWKLCQFPQNQMLCESEFLKLLAEHLPKLKGQQYDHVRHAAAIAAYQGQEDWPVVELLLSDDAPQFKTITSKLALCWVHDGRHYKKLSPHLPHHRQILEDFRKKYWDYYRELLVYKEKPGADEAERLSQKFDKLFSQQTGYTLLDLRISATMSNKKSLLMVLDHPDLPLHNNDSELSARTRVRKRDVSFGPRSREGTHAWDLYMSLLVTARKLGINFHEYLRDRISGSFNMPSLAELIRQRGSPQTNSLLETPLLAAA